ncbi:MAG: glycosyltransferase family 25 protein, partial [Betaproteobacteria bacterium]
LSSESTMHIFVINLPDALERRESITRQLKGLGLPFEIFPAIRGKTLTPEERRLHYDENKFIRNVGSTASAGELGCSLSHIAVYRLIVERNIPHACILEDDAWLNPNLPQLLQAIEQKFYSENMDVFLLSWAKIVCNKLSARIWSSYHATNVYLAYCTHGYVVSNVAARSLIDALYPVKNTADCWGWIRRHRIVKVQAVVPPCITQDLSYGSSVSRLATEAESIIKRSGLRLVLHKSIRALWLVLDHISALCDRWHNRKNSY